MKNLLGKWITSKSKDGNWDPSVWDDTLEEAVITAIIQDDLYVTDKIWCGQIRMLEVPRGFIFPSLLNSIYDGYIHKLEILSGGAIKSVDIEWFQDIGAEGDSHQVQTIKQAEDAALHAMENALLSTLERYGLWNKTKYWKIDNIQEIMITTALHKKAMIEAGELCAHCGAKIPPTIDECSCQDEEDT